MKLFFQRETKQALKRGQTCVGLGAAQPAGDQGGRGDGGLGLEVPGDGGTRPGFGLRGARPLALSRAGCSPSPSHAAVGGKAPRREPSGSIPEKAGIPGKARPAPPPPRATLCRVQEGPQRRDSRLCCHRAGTEAPAQRPRRRSGYF